LHSTKDSPTEEVIIGNHQTRENEDKSDLEIEAQIQGDQLSDQTHQPKKVYGAWIGNVGVHEVPKENPTFNQYLNLNPLEPLEIAQKKKNRQHRGLRCKKCFYLLVRDEDFEYKNGQLWVKDTLKKIRWEGLKFKGNNVFCQNMHPVGVLKHSTWTNMTKYVPILKVDKTTFIENFINNPKYVDSPLIVNKLVKQETSGEDWLKLNLLEEKYLPKVDENLETDRYHPQSTKTTGVQ